MWFEWGSLIVRLRNKSSSRFIHMGKNWWRPGPTFSFLPFFYRLLFLFLSLSYHFYLLLWVVYFPFYASPFPYFFHFRFIPWDKWMAAWSLEGNCKFGDRNSKLLKINYVSYLGHCLPWNKRPVIFVSYLVFNQF